MAQDGSHWAMPLSEAEADAVSTWAPHPGPAAAVGQAVAVVVAEEKVPGWGQQTRHDERDAQIRAANQFDRNRQLAIDREARAQAASDERHRHARVLARHSNYPPAFVRDWARQAPAEPQSQHAQGQHTPSNPRARNNQSSRNQSGGKRKHQNNDSSDDERDSIWSQSASEQGYSSNQPSSSHRKKDRKQKPPQFDAHRAQLTQEADTTACTPIHIHNLH